MDSVPCAVDQSPSRHVHPGVRVQSSTFHIIRARQLKFLHLLRSFSSAGPNRAPGRIARFAPRPSDGVIEWIALPSSVTLAGFSNVLGTLVRISTIKNDAGLHARTRGAAFSDHSLTRPAASSCSSADGAVCISSGKYSCRPANNACGIDSFCVHRVLGRELLRCFIKRNRKINRPKAKRTLRWSDQ